MKIKSKLILGFTFMLFLTLMLGITSIVNLSEVSTRFEFLVTHDLNVLQNAQHLQKLVVDAETGQRGFVITGDEAFLEPYKSGVSEFYTLIQVEKELVSDNPSQVKKLETIENLFDMWNENAAIPEIELARNIYKSGVNDDGHSHLEDVALLIQSGTGKNILDNIRSEFIEFTQTENDLNGKRFQDTLELSLNTKIVIFLASIFSIIFVIIILILLLRTIIQPITKLESASIEMARGNLNVDVEHKGNDEISSLTKSFNIMKNSIKENQEKEKILTIEKIKNERLASIGELSARIAHDIRNPLSVINSDFFMLTKEHPELDPDAVHRIRRGIDRINHQVEGVLDFVRKTTPELNKTKFSEIISDSLSSLNVPDNIKIILPKNDVEFICDKKLFSIVMNNLILNGIQAIDGIGTIEITVEDNEDEITIQIKDSGKLIPKEHMDKIFEPLFTTNQEGTGLGLASVKSIIGIHGGTISVTSPPVIFTITLPKNQ